MKTTRRRLTTLLAAVALTAIAAHPALAGSVNESNLGNDWFFVAETGSGSGQFVDGPADPPIGTGSAEISVGASADGFVLIGDVLGGTKLADIDSLHYGTYRAEGDAAWAVSLQFAVNYDPASNPTNAWQGRLAFEPYLSETVVTGAWQTWDTQTQGRWWATGAPGNTVCSLNSECTWTELLSAFPNAEIRNEPFPFVFKAGSGWGAFTGNVDGFAITIAGSETVYDFGPEPQPESGDDDGDAVDDDEGTGGDDTDAVDDDEGTGGDDSDAADDDEGGETTVTTTEGAPGTDEGAAQVTGIPTGGAATGDGPVTHTSSVMAMLLVGMLTLLVLGAAAGEARRRSQASGSDLA